jgi:hypothetical protein
MSGGKVIFQKSKPVVGAFVASGYVVRVLCGLGELCVKQPCSTALIGEEESSHKAHKEHKGHKQGYFTTTPQFLVILARVDGLGCWF